MPRYSTLAISRVPSPWPSPPVGEREGKLVVHDERGARGRHGPAEVHGDRRVLHLPALALRIVVAVLALGPAGAVVVHEAAELSHVLDDHAHAVGVALAQMAARGVVRPFASELDDAARDVRAALALLAEAVLLELEHGGEGEGVIGAGDVDVVRRDPCLPEHDVLGV